MAILGAITCDVEVDKRAIREYADPDERRRYPGVVTKYVEAVSGKEFFIRVGFAKFFKPTCNAIAVYVYIDGQHCNDRIAFRDWNHPRLADKEVILNGFERTAPDGRRWRAPFKFQDISVSNTAHRNTPIQDITSLGKIEVHVYNYEASQDDKVPNYSHRYPTTYTKVPEKLLKGSTLSHSVGLGTERPINPSTIYNGQEVGGPIVTFIFKYRSRQALKSLLVIRRSPTPPPSTEVLQARIRELEAAAKREIKTETAQVVKRERDEEVDEILATARVNKRRKATGEYKGIDLIDLEIEEHEDAIVID